MAAETKKLIALDDIKLLYADLLQQIEQKYTRPRNGIGRKDLHAKILDDLDNKISAEEWEYKADSVDTTLYTTLSRGRASDSTIGNYSFAFGSNVIASGENSHAEGIRTTASGRSQHVFGEYNIEDNQDESQNSYTYDHSRRHKYVEIIGNGIADDQRSNARTLDWSGNEALAGSITLGKGTADEVTITAAQMKSLLALLNT